MVIQKSLAHMHQMYAKAGGFEQHKTSMHTRAQSAMHSFILVELWRQISASGTRMIHVRTVQMLATNAGHIPIEVFVILHKAPRYALVAV
jgi:hypothetical protein